MVRKTSEEKITEIERFVEQNPDVGLRVEQSPDNSRYSYAKRYRLKYRERALPGHTNYAYINRVYNVYTAFLFGFERGFTLGWLEAGAS